MAWWRGRSNQCQRRLPWLPLLPADRVAPRLLGEALPRVAPFRGGCSSCFLSGCRPLGSSIEDAACRKKQTEQKQIVTSPLYLTLCAAAKDAQRASRAGGRLRVHVRNGWRERVVCARVYVYVCVCAVSETHHGR